MVNALHTMQVDLKNIQIVRDKRIILAVPDERILLSGITACIGPNGAGKTTLLKLLHGLIAVNENGSVHYSEKIKSALVLHHTPMIKASVRANLGIGIQRRPNPADFDLVLREIGLAHIQNQPAHQLSAGEKQKLALGRARLQRPNLLILDEPTANLDPTTTEQVEGMIRSFAASGCNVLISSHQLAQVQRLADHILFVDDGLIKEKGACTPFFKQPKTEAALRYLQREHIANG